MKFPWDKVKIPPKAERCGSKTIRDMYIRLQRDSGNGETRIPSKNTMIQKLKQERKRIQDDFLKVKKDADINELLDLAEQKYARSLKKLQVKILRKVSLNFKLFSRIYLLLLSKR